MTQWSLQKLLHALATDLETQLSRSRELIGHPTDKGDLSERLWLELLQKYLPKRYEARRAHVVDSCGAFSDQIDIVIHDRQYSPFVFSYGGAEIVPAESVYAIFEVKQTLDATNVAYAKEKIASVRKLHRTSLPIPTADGIKPAKIPHHILGGLLTLASSWSPPLGNSFNEVLPSLDLHQQIDFVCVADVGTFELEANGLGTTLTSQGAAARFLLSLLARLQQIATVPMIDVQAYAQWLK